MRAGAPTSGAALANAALGLFDSYSEIGPYNYVLYRGNLFEWFVQDSWKATRRLQIEYGVRHSLEQPYYALWRNISFFGPQYYDPKTAAVVDPKTGAITGGDVYDGIVIPGSGFPKDAVGRLPFDPNSVSRLFRGADKSYSQFHMKDFQPRIGLAYLLATQTVVRAGVGRYLLRPPITDTFNPGLNPPFQPSAFISNGSVDNPSGGASQTFPANVGTQDLVLRNPNSWVWNVTAERSLPGSMLLSVGYVGRRGLEQVRWRNENQMLPGTVQANPGINQNALRPYSGYGQIYEMSYDGSSRYNGLQLALTRRYRNGLLYGVAYTYSKSSDDTSTNGELLPNAYNARPYWGPSAFDRRHVMVINFAYDLPFFPDRHRLVGKVLGGWQINGINQFQTGTPVTVSTGDDFAGVGSGQGSQIWQVNGNPQLSRGQRGFASSVSDNNFWFRTTNADGSAIFVTPANGTFTSQNNRDLLYAPGFISWNAALVKSVTLAEHHALMFRFEVYDWPNHPNWNSPNLNPRNLTTFGKVTSKSLERNLQLSLRYSF